MQETWTENRKRSAWMTVDEYNINFYFSSKVLLCTVLYCTALTGQSDGVNAPFWDQTDQISSVSRDRVNRHVCTKRPRMKHADPEFPSGQILNATKLCLIAAHLSVSKSCVFSPGSFLFSRIARSRRALSFYSQPLSYLIVATSYQEVFGCSPFLSSPWSFHLRYQNSSWIICPRISTMAIFMRFSAGIMVIDVVTSCEPGTLVSLRYKFWKLDGTRMCYPALISSFDEIVFFPSRPKSRLRFCGVCNRGRC